MNCCNEYGMCTQGKDCPGRPVVTPQPASTKSAAEVARRANEHIRRLEAGRAHLLTLTAKPRLHIRVLDWIGNLPRRIGRWVDRSPALQLACLAVGLVTACALTALSALHKF